MLTAAIRQPRSLGRSLLLVTIIVGALGCDSLAPSTGGPSSLPVSPQPSGPAVLGVDWGRAASVERPANYEETVSPSYQAQHSILRIQGQAMMTDVIGLPGGGFVAVGYVPPDWQPVAWTSATGVAWTLKWALGTTDYTFPISLASGSGGTVVAVGRSGHDPVAWTTTDGLTWQRHAVAVLGTDGTAEVRRAGRGRQSGRSTGGRGVDLA